MKITITGIVTTRFSMDTRLIMERDRSLGKVAFETYSKMTFGTTAWEDIDQGEKDFWNKIADRVVANCAHYACYNKSAEYSEWCEEHRDEREFF